MAIAPVTAFSSHTQNRSSSNINFGHRNNEPKENKPHRSSSSVMKALPIVVLLTTSPMVSNTSEAQTLQYSKNRTEQTTPNSKRTIKIVSPPKMLDNGVYSYGTTTVISKYDNSICKFTKFRLKDGSEFLTFQYEKEAESKGIILKLNGVVKGLCTQMNEDEMYSKYMVYEVLDPDAPVQGTRICKINGDYAMYIYNMAKEPENSGLVQLGSDASYEKSYGREVLKKAPFIKYESNTYVDNNTNKTYYVRPSFWNNVKDL